MTETTETTEISLTQMYKYVAHNIQPKPSCYVVDDGASTMEEPMLPEEIQWDRVGVSAYELTNIIWIMGGPRVDGHGVEPTWTLEFVLNWGLKRIDIQLLTDRPGVCFLPFFSVAGLSGQMDQGDLNALVATTLNDLLVGLGRYVDLIKSQHAEYASRVTAT